MDYRNIFALAALIFSIGHTWNGIQSAHAYPTGPNVSQGSNPIHQAYKYCNGLSNETLVANTSNQDFIVTDIVVSNGGVDILIDGITIMFNTSGHIALRTGLKVSSGSTISCSDYSSYPGVTITGYYTHT